MNLKYYLRGLGLGMAVTAFILGIAFAVRSKENTMTDAQVIARAKELGMTESTVLSKTQPQEETKEPQPEPELEKTKQPEALEEEPKSESESETLEESKEPVSIEPEGETEPEDETEPEPEGETETKPEGETEPVLELAVLEIVRGDSSDSVSRKLADMGLVENAAEYDKYLCANGYDKKIRTGTYEIPKGTTEEEIARIIAGK